MPMFPRTRASAFELGSNLGDVIVEPEDIFGDGGNIAARVQALAEPGGICISRVVRDQIRDKLSYTFADMGEQSVKNIARPVRIYRAMLEGARTVGIPTFENQNGRMMEGDGGAAILDEIIRNGRRQSVPNRSVKSS
jgi:class 3 adenylate cyclase